MYMFLLILLVLGTQFTLTACTIQRVPLTPLTALERQALGTIGIAAEASRLETQYSRDPSVVDDGLRAMQDRLTDAGQGAIDGAKWVDYRSSINPRPVCRTPRSRLCFKESVASVLFTALFKGVLMTGGGIVGGVVGAIDRKTYSNPPMMDLPEEADIQAVKESIDAVGLPEQLGDQVCIRHRTWEFEGGSYRIDEWRKNDAKLLVDELDRGLPLIAQRVAQAFFEQPSLFSFRAFTAVTPKSESLACRG